MEGQRVNKITSVFNNEGGVTMTLYRTNTKLASITNYDVQVKPFDESGAQSKPAYMSYCKEMLINLLQNGGIEGYYYDPVSHSEQANSGMPRKFNQQTFTEWSSTIVRDKLESMGEALGVTYDISDQFVEPEITESYGDGNIKYGMVAPVVAFTSGDNKYNVRIPVEIKSGQLCKPKVMVIQDGSQKNLNPTNVKALFGDKLATSSSKPIIKEPQAPKTDKEIQGEMDAEMNKAILEEQMKVNPTAEDEVGAMGEDQQVAMEEVKPKRGRKKGQGNAGTGSINKVMDMISGK